VNCLMRMASLMSCANDVEGCRENFS
jgi:hypothetical protein